MGGVCSVVEGVLAAGFVAEGIAEAVLKAKIEALLDQHEQEFKLMDALNSFLDKLLDQQNLVSQLNANVMSATDNWNSIFDDLQDQNDLLKKIMEKFPNVNPADFSYSFSDGMKFAVQILALGYIAYNFAAGNARAQISQNLAQFKDFCAKTGEKIRGTAPEIQAAKTNEDGTLQIQSEGSNPEKVPPQVRQSKINSVKEQEKQGAKSIVATGIRLIFIAVAIYGFVQGVIGLVHLKEQLDTYQQFFSTAGDFENAEKGVINLMVLAAGDIFTLANCTRAAFYDSKNMFLVRSITMPRNHDIVLGNAKRMNPLKFGLTDLFISKSQELINSCNTTVQSQKDIKGKLQDLVDCFQAYFDSQKPEEIFLNSSKELSQVVSKYGVIEDDINKDSHNVVRFLTAVSEFFEDYRGSDFENKSAQDKKNSDQNIITKSLDKYLTIFGLDDTMTLEKMDPSTKDIIFYAMTSFANTFYYDDPTGATLFGRNIKQSKAAANYSDIINKEESKADLFPVSYDDQAEEAKEVQTWLDMANQQNEKEGSVDWKAGDKLESKFRYIRLEVTKSTDAEGKEVGDLTNYEGIKFEVNKSIFTLERATVGDGTLKLEKVL